jgi:hypothetical protein
MPAIVKQKPKAQPPAAPMADLGGCLGTIMEVRSLKPAFQKVCIYGRNRLGKSTLAAMWPKPMLVLASEPAEHGGVGSIINMEGVNVAVISVKPQIDPRTGNPESVFGTAKALSIVAELNAITQQQGRCPFATVVMDTVTSMQDIALTEIMGLPEIPTMLGWGLVSDDQYRMRAEKIREIMRKVKDLRTHTIFIAQEKDHNPPKGRDVNRILKPRQEESFFGASLGGAAAGWLHDTCDYVGQLYQDAEMREEISRVQIGDQVQEERVQLPTGRIVRRFRTVYSPNYAGGMRAPNPGVVPLWIEAETPKEMYEEIQTVIRGERTSKGFYGK